MSKAKNFGFFVILVVVILITFGITRYSGQKSIPLKCEKDNETDFQYSPKPVTSNFSRLPTNVVPINYDLELQPFLRPDLLFFKGTVNISVTCRKSTNAILLNANELDIKTDEIVINIADDKSESKIELSGAELKNEVLTLKLKKDLIQNKNYTIFLSFRGNLTSSLSGFYRSSYTENNQTKYLAMTQFQATDARKAFPCFDEPAFKATFNLEMIHLSNMTAIANMPNISTKAIDSDWTKTTFDKTVPMSTYLVAFAVGDFRFNENQGTVPKYRIVSRPSEIDSTQRAMEFGPAILKHYEDYFKIKFPLPKIDMLACPDFSAGAMENWGLITYREAYLLFDKRVGSVTQLYRIASVIAHELAHQWFGNLVTPSFWSDLWLNEGFATYMSYEGVEAVRPDWRIWDSFVLDEIHDVLQLDSLKNSHPVSVEVNDPSEISELFDHISYEKSASIIRMMAHTIGHQTFRQGLNTYLNKFAYGNAEQADLWKHLQMASDKNNVKVDVKKVMDSWTLKVGYPLVTITRDYNSNKVRFSQHRFLMNEKNKDVLSNVQYEVPITYTTSHNLDWHPETKLWLHKNESGESSAIEEVKLSPDDWLIGNVQEVGFYRVNYDEKNWNLLIKQLHEDHTRIHRINRAQILDDLFHLAENGVVKYELALKALEYLKNETDTLQWKSVAHLTYLINRMLRRTESYGSWTKYVRQLIKPTYEKIKMKEIENENLEEQQMQKAIVSMACSYNLEECVQSSKDLFKKLMDEKANNASALNNIPPNVRSVVYCTAIFHGNESEWDFLFDLYREEQSSNERSTMLQALTCSRIPWILARYLKWMFDESSGIKTQDGVYAFKGVASNNYGKDIAFNFLRENWEKIYAIHGKQMSFAHIVKTLESVNSVFELKLVKEFHRTLTSNNKIGSAKRAFSQTIEQIEANILWMKQYESEIAKFLKKFEEKQ